MKQLLFILFLLLASVTVTAIDQPAKKQPVLHHLPVAMQRYIAALSPQEFSLLTGKKLNFIQKLGYKKLQKKCRKKLAAIDKANLYDTLYLTNGNFIPGIVLGISNDAIHYKTKSTEQLLQVKRSELSRIAMAPLAKDTTPGKEEKNIPIEKTATWSMITGISSIVLLFSPLSLITPLAAVAALVLGIVAHQKIKKSNGKLRGQGRATAGIVLFGVYMLALAAIIVLILSFTVV